MKVFTILGLLLLAPAAGFAAPAPQAAPCTSATTIGRIDINGYDGTTIVGDSANIRARVTSACQLQTVVAEAFGHTITLSYDSLLASWVGNMSLANDPHVEFGLTITVTDINGAVATRTISLIHDTPPSLVVVAPTPSTVARPALHVSLSCSDDGPAGCAGVSVKVVTIGGNNQYPDIVLASGVAEIDQDISLAAYEGQRLELDLTGWDWGQGPDPHGQPAHVRRMVYVDSSPRLTEITRAPGAVIDDSPDRTLFLASDRDPSVVQWLDLREKATGDVVPLTTVDLDADIYGRVTDRGAIFLTRVRGNDSLYEYRDGALTPLAPENSHPTDLRVAGGFAVWRAGNPTRFLFRRDLRTGTTVTVQEQGGTSPDVATNGDVVYYGAGGSPGAFRYRDGATTLLTNPVSLAMPRTDGINVAYRYYNPPTSQLLTGTGEITLADFSGQSGIAPGYALNGGWTAFTAPLGADINVWRRAPDGAIAQASFFGGASSIDALNDDAAVTIRNGNRLWLAGPDGSVTEIAHFFGAPNFTRSFWRAGGLFLITGASVFTVDLPYTPVSPPTVTLTPDSASVGSALTSAVANAPGNATAWIGLFAEGASDRAFAAWCYLNGARTAPAAAITTTATGCFTAPAPGRYHVRLFANNGFTKIATSNTVTVSAPVTPPAPAVALTPDTPAVGTTLTAAVTAAPGNATDWLGLFPEGAGDKAFVAWCYLNGAKTPPAIAMTSAVVPCFTAAAPGRYQVRLFSSNGFTKLATSNTITVSAPITPPGPTAALTPDPAILGAALTVTVTMALGNRTDWVGLFSESATDTTFINWCYLNGTKTAPAAEVTSATVTCFTPAMPGRYQARLFSNNGFTKVATSNTITVAGPTVTLAPDPATVGTTLTVTATTMAGTATDWVGLFREGAGDTAFINWCYLNGAKIPPATPMASVSVACLSPAASGRYQVRLFSNDGFTRLATSNTITVP